MDKFVGPMTIFSEDALPNLAITLIGTPLPVDDCFQSLKNLYCKSTDTISFLSVSSMSEPEKRTKSRKGRCYMTDQEKDVLRQMLPIWSNMTDRKSREAYILTTVASKIQQLNLPQFGPEIIARDKEAKTLWERRVQVRPILLPLSE